MARDQGPDVVLNPQQMNILIPTVSPESVEALVFDLGGVLLDVQLQRTLRAFEALDIRGLGAAEVIDGNRACFRDLELGLITQEEFAEAVRRTFPAVAAIPDEQLLEAWNAMLMPSVRSISSAWMAKCCSTRAIASAGCASLLLISPLAGNAAIRSRTSSPRVFPFRHSSSVTSSHGIIPLSQ